MTNQLEVGKYYWVTYNWRHTYPNGTHGLDQEAIEELKCEAVIGECGIFDTLILGTKRIHHSRCAPSARKPSFWESLLSL